MVKKGQKGGNKWHLLEKGGFRTLSKNHQNGPKSARTHNFSLTLREIVGKSDPGTTILTIFDTFLTIFTFILFGPTPNFDHFWPFFCNLYIKFTHRPTQNPENLTSVGPKILENRGPDPQNRPFLTPF